MDNTNDVTEPNFIEQSTGSQVKNSSINRRNIRIITILILKDFRIHLFGLVVALGIPFAFIACGFSISISYYSDFEVRDCIYLMNRIGLLMPLLFGEFLLEKEKKSGANIMLRSMPVSDGKIYFSKNLLSWLILIVSQIPGFMFLYIYFEDVPVFTYPLIIITLLCFATSAIFILILKLGYRITFVISGVTIAMIIYLWRVFENHNQILSALVVQNHYLYLLASLLFICFTFFLIQLGTWHFLVRDTRELM